MKDSILITITFIAFLVVVYTICEMYSLLGEVGAMLFLVAIGWLVIFARANAEKLKRIIIKTLS